MLCTFHFPAVCSLHSQMSPNLAQYLPHPLCKVIFTSVTPPTCWAAVLETGLKFQRLPLNHCGQSICRMRLGVELWNICFSGWHNIVCRLDNKIHLSNIKKTVFNSVSCLYSIWDNLFFSDRAYASFAFNAFNCSIFKCNLAKQLDGQDKSEFLKSNAGCMSSTPLAGSPALLPNHSTGIKKKNVKIKCWKTKYRYSNLTSNTW